MKRILLIILSMVMALAGWSTVGADDGFYVIPTMKGNYAPVPKTGQITSYDTRDDGELQTGVASPSPRFIDNSNGTVTDKLTGLIWQKNAGAIGPRTWNEALSAANTLKSGDYDLADGSKAGDWRLPNIRELQSLVDYGRLQPALPAGHPFTGGEFTTYWSSTRAAFFIPTHVWLVNFYYGTLDALDESYDHISVWCVRGGP
jgi:hypothetical protein